MSYPRSFLGLLVATTALTAACSGPEKAIVDRYFGALAMGDNQTLTSFAAVRLEDEVEAYEIVSASEEVVGDAMLPALAKKHAEVLAELNENKTAARKFALDNIDDVDEVQALLEEEKSIPKRLEEVATQWQDYEANNAKLRSEESDAKVAMQSELKICQLSVGNAVDGLESFPGKVHTKTVDLSLTIGGQKKPYTMTLRRYALEADDTVRLNSRWVVYDLQPKG